MLVRSSVRGCLTLTIGALCALPAHSLSAHSLSAHSLSAHSLSAHAQSAHAQSAHAQSVPAFSIGALNATITEPFSRLYGATEMRDGRVIVSDVKDALLAVADFRTGKATTLGRNGEGPNEYALPGIALRTPGDSFYIVDGRNQRFLRLNGSGELAGTVPFARELMMGGIGGGDMASDSQGALLAVPAPINIGIVRTDPAWARIRSLPDFRSLESLWAR